MAIQPEIATLIQNGKALFEQIEQMLGGAAEGGAETAPDDISPADVEKIAKILKEMGAMHDEPDADNGVVKAEDPEEPKEEVEKSDEGTHANDSAKQVIEDQGEVNEDNIKEVAKAIVKAIAAKKAEKSVKKSVVQKVPELEEMRSEVNELRKGLENIFEGLGIAERIKAANAVQKSAPVREIKNDENEIKKSLEWIKNQLQPQEVVSTGWGWDNQKGNGVRKSFADAISNIVQK